MSKPGLQINFDAGAFDKALHEKLQGLQHRRPLMAQLANDMLNAVQDNFKQGGRPQWAPLKPATVRRKAKAGHEKPLIWSNHLQNSITAAHDNDAAVVGTNTDYAAIHQFGGSIQRQAGTVKTYHKADKKTGLLQSRFVKKKLAQVMRTHAVGAYTIHIPARPFLAITDADRQTLRATVKDWFLNIK